MLFNSLTFLVFFACVFALHAALPSWTGRKLLLLAASYLFYAAWHPPYVLILGVTTAIDWWLARLIYRTRDRAKRKALLLLSLASNLGMLGFFKYGGFLLANFQAALAVLGVAYQPPQWMIVLPIGISFYTFASLSYTIDVYRGRYPGNASLLDYALFVGFFPHLVAGPIVRAAMLVPQFERPRRASADQIGWGLSLLCMGLFQKAVMADAVFAPVVDALYGNPSAHRALDAWIAVFGFSGQIYYDFSGYSLCAIGLALCFGFEFPDNFRHPYAARGFSDFWRRWHISLSSWVRDYLYIPMGGGHAPSWRRNLLLAMLLIGLWHGASWMFVLWGLLHGLYLVAERGWQEARPRQAAGAAVATTALTFVVVTLTWIPFRAPNPALALDVVRALFDFRASPNLDNASIYACLAIGATVLWHFRLRDSSLESWYASVRPLAQGAALAASLLTVFLVSGGDERAFIYFQF